MSADEERLHKDLSDSWWIVSQRQALKNNGYEPDLTTLAKLNAHSNAEGSLHGLASAGAGALGGAALGYLAGGKHGAIIGASGGMLMGAGYDMHHQLKEVYPNEIKKFIDQKQFKKAGE